MRAEKQAHPTDKKEQRAKFLTICVRHIRENMKAALKQLVECAHQSPSIMGPFPMCLEPSILHLSAEHNIPRGKRLGFMLCNPAAG